MLYLTEVDELIESEEFSKLRAEGALAKYELVSAGDVSSDGSAVMGADGYIFINDGSNFWREQLSGEIAIHPDQLSASLDLLKQYKVESDKRGISFQFLIIPEKDVVLRNQSPNVTSNLAEQRTAQAFIGGIDFPAIYPVDEMVNVPDGVRIFHRRDSHFNFLGGFIVSNSLLRAMEMEPLSLLECKSDHVAWQDDLSSKWGEFKVLRRQLRKTYTETVVKESESTHFGLQLLIKSTRVKDGSSILIYGDSYSWNFDAGIARFMTLRFENVHFVWHKRIDWELVDALKPDVLVLESAERFLFRGI